MKATILAMAKFFRCEPREALRFLSPAEVNLLKWEALGGRP